MRVIDTLGALIGGFFGEASRIARDVAARMPQPAGATVIGTRLTTSPDMAAFVNGTTARYVEMNDVYHWPGIERRPSERRAHAGVRRRGIRARERPRICILAVVLAYEIYLRMSDAVRTPGFDCANFCCMGSALGAGKLLGLSPDAARGVPVDGGRARTTRSTRRAPGISRCGKRSPRASPDARAFSRRCSRRPA